jgi:tRNA-dihydrouridine synthase C
MTPIFHSWIQPDRPALVLAPMEGVTDSPMRAFLSELGGFRFCVTEFVRVSQWVPGVRVFQKRIPELCDGARTPAGLPVQVQLLGGDPELLAEAALIALEAGACAIDLNFGCPARTVNRHDGGASLLQHPERIRAIVAGVRAAVPPSIPVSAKLRLGWDDMCAIHTNAERAAEGGAAWITIHARTKSQGYRPPAYWGPLRDVRRRLGIPVVANGEIWTIDDMRRCRDETGCEHFMLGRGALADPTLARQAAAALGGEDRASRIEDRGPPELPNEWLPFLRRFAAINTEAGRPPFATLARIKQWLNLANHAGQLAWFEGLKRVTELDEFLNRIADVVPSSTRRAESVSDRSEAPLASFSCM